MASPEPRGTVADEKVTLQFLSFFVCYGSSAAGTSATNSAKGAFFVSSVCLGVLWGKEGGGAWSDQPRREAHETVGPVVREAGVSRKGTRKTSLGKNDSSFFFRL